MNTMAVDVVSEGDVCSLRLEGRSLPFTGMAARQVRTGTATLGIRPEDLTVCSREEAWLSGELAVAERLGSQTYGYLEVGEARMLTVEFPRNTPISVGERIYVRPDMDAIHLFDTASGQRLN